MTVGAVVVGAWRLLHRRLLREGWLRLLSVRQVASKPGTVAKFDGTWGLITRSCQV